MSKEPSQELLDLREKADFIGVTYSGNTGVDKLREKINEKMEATNAKSGKSVPTDSERARHNKLRKEATKLIRCIVTNINPVKRDFRSEFLRVGNRVVPTVSRLIPFEQETHIEAILYNHLKTRKFVIVKHEKNNEGKLVPVRYERNEFQIHVLDDLTAEDLAELAVEQAKRQSV